MTEAQAFELAWLIIEKHVERIAASTPSKSRAGSAKPMAVEVKEALMCAYNDGWENGFEAGQGSRW